MNKDTESEKTPTPDTDKPAAEQPEPAQSTSATDEAMARPPATESDDAGIGVDGEKVKPSSEAVQAEDKPKQKAVPKAKPPGNSGASPRRRPGSGRSGRSNRLLVTVLVLVLMIAGLAWLVFWGWQQYRVLQQESETVVSSLSELRQQVSSLSVRLESSNSERERLAQRVQQEQQALESMLIETAQRLSRRQDLDADRWPLEEALTLLRLAERRLQLDGDATIAISLLNAADQVLAGLTEAAVLPVRRQIASDRLALQSVSSVDLNGTYFRLEAISERIASRQWSPAERLEPQPQSNETPLSWQSFQDSLSSLVTVSRLDVPYQAPPLLSEFAQWQQHSLLLTEQVQLALLARNQPLYNEALAQLLVRVGAMSPELELSAIEAELESMQGLTLTPDFPDIHASVETLEQYMTRVETEATEPADNGEDDA
ncbi:uroporphyrinogen-III C-methyltransferase [Saccharospirillum impatiens]|uniref:uroporphyrinogen-III C-methyltransferase n=1 Tax=Saccharospirillum impatiens TaxID=169438 RepID=UPI000416982C|nr:uroporphyrinogen-III C-methyltransferase [Saccharospirillum impatiens]